MPLLCTAANRADRKWQATYSFWGQYQEMEECHFTFDGAELLGKKPGLYW